MPEPSANVQVTGTSAETLLEIPRDVVSDTHEGEAVVLNLTTGIYFGLNQTGTRIWDLLHEVSDIPSIVERMTAEFDCDAATIEADVRSLVEHLVERGLLSRVGANSR